MIVKKVNSKFNVIGFDADDTLWENENLFYEVQRKFKKILGNHNNDLDQELLNIEKQNLEQYGYGIKGFILSLIETSTKLSNTNVGNEKIEEILNLGKKMLSEPVKVLPYVKTSLESLSKDYNLILITKGDLLDQEKKIKGSELSKFFNHIEIVSEKNETTYMKILDKYNINPEKFLMVGNSLKSDILPVTKIGGTGIYIPFELTWELEKVVYDHKSKAYVQLENISLIRPWLEKKLKNDNYS